MSNPPVPPKGHYLRREWKIEKRPNGNPNRGYIPSHEREGFDEKNVEVLPPVLSKPRR